MCCSHCDSISFDKTLLSALSNLVGRNREEKLSPVSRAGSLLEGLAVLQPVACLGEATDTPQPESPPPASRGPGSPGCDEGPRCFW